jgi:hypothetical protein
LALNAEVAQIQADERSYRSSLRLLPLGPLDIEELQSRTACVVIRDPNKLFAISRLEITPYLDPWRGRCRFDDRVQRQAAKTRGFMAVWPMG